MKKTPDTPIPQKRGFVKRILCEFFVRDIAAPFFVGEVPLKSSFTFIPQKPKVCANGFFVKFCGCH